jgi:oxygen-independent coproporphyrinogen-3 oxidase
MSKCHFCDWVVDIPKSDLFRRSSDPIRNAYITALCAEVRARSTWIKKARRVPHVIYWGGGTASSLDEAEIERVSAALSDSLDLSRVDEATIECSPDTVSYSKLKFFRSLGFTRFSTGVQSLDDARLRALGRRHNAKSAQETVHLAADLNFSEINIDLMSGFPGQELKELEGTIKAALTLPISQISLYSFRPTVGTSLAKKFGVQPLSEIVRHQLYLFNSAREMIANAGFSEYALGYFGTPARSVVLPFQLRVETMGFGSGAMSLLDGSFHLHRSGALAEYINDPMQWSFSAPARSTAVALSNLRCGLSVFEGVRRAEWKLQTGESLEMSLAQVSLQTFVQRLRDSYGLVESIHGIRLPKDRAAEALLRVSLGIASQGRTW